MFYRDIFQLEAKNKIIIEQRIKKYENERNILLKKCFEKWSQVLIHRRKQQGTAAAFYDWRITKRAFVRWKRFTRVEKENRMVHLEKTKAKRIEIYKSTLLTRKNHIILAKYFNSLSSHEPPLKDRLLPLLAALFIYCSLPQGTPSFKHALVFSFNVINVEFLPFYHVLACHNNIWGQHIKSLSCPSTLLESS